uniref:Protoheme IX farnesyltransferase, mitochondrial n=1 Tax=Toxoplasma gondii COUG TaxID=1074873 RepID=A0A2G8Y500_TOXGO|nr:prenyltransferase, UbiA family protein [Toxoplasma gondii COUG]
MQGAGSRNLLHRCRCRHAWSSDPSRLGGSHYRMRRIGSSFPPVSSPDSGVSVILCAPEVSSTDVGIGSLAYHDRGQLMYISLFSGHMHPKEEASLHCGGDGGSLKGSRRPGGHTCSRHHGHYRAGSEADSGVGRRSGFSTWWHSPSYSDIAVPESHLRKRTQMRAIHTKEHFLRHTGRSAFRTWQLRCTVNRSRVFSSQARVCSTPPAVVDSTGARRVTSYASKCEVSGGSFAWPGGSSGFIEGECFSRKVHASDSEQATGEEETHCLASSFGTHQRQAGRPSSTSSPVPLLRAWRFPRECAAYWALSKGRLSAWVALSTLAGYAGGMQALPDFWTGIASGAGSGVGSTGLLLLQEAAVSEASTGAASVLTAVVSGVTAAQLAASVGALFAGVFGSSAAANALNQLYERKLDSLMKRTRHRPVASGYLSPSACATFAALSAAAGVSLLSAHFPNMTAAALAAFNIALYAGVYTPLKTKNPYSTHVGAVVGAIPLLIGWSAAGGSLACLHPWILFGLQYFWQFPHFYMLCWLHRADYQRGGYKMFGVADDQHAVQTKMLCRRYLGALLLTPLVSSTLDVTTWMFVVSSLPANIFIAHSFQRFCSHPEKASGRHFFLHSLWHIMLLLGLAVYHMKPVSPSSPSDCSSKGYCQTSSCAISAEEDVCLDRPGYSYMRMLLATPLTTLCFLYRKVELGVVQLCPMLRRKRCDNQQSKDGEQRCCIPRPPVIAGNEGKGEQLTREGQEPPLAGILGDDRVKEGHLETFNDAGSAKRSRSSRGENIGSKSDSLTSGMSLCPWPIGKGKHTDAESNCQLHVPINGEERQSLLPTYSQKPFMSRGISIEDRNSGGVLHCFNGLFPEYKEANLVERVRCTLSQFCPHEYLFGLQRGCPVSQAASTFLPQFGSGASGSRMTDGVLSSSCREPSERPKPPP